MPVNRHAQFVRHITAIGHFAATGHPNPVHNFLGCQPTVAASGHRQGMADESRYTALIRQAAEFGGFVTLGQAAAAGLTEAETSTLVRRGDWLRIDRGIRRVADSPADDEWRDRLRAALLTAGPGAVAAGHTAARLLGIIGSPTPRALWLAVPRGRHPEPRPGVRVMRVAVSDDELVSADGIPATRPLRTLLDAARYGGQLPAVCLLESAMRQQLVDFASVFAAVDAIFGKRGAIAARSALRRVDLRSESPLETKARLILVDAGLRYPRPQQPLAPGDSRRIDLAYLAARGSAYCGVAIEIDGREIHARADAFHDDPRRQTALEEADWLVRRFTDRHLSDVSYVVGTVRRALTRAGCR